MGNNVSVQCFEVLCNKLTKRTQKLGRLRDLSGVPCHGVPTCLGANPLRSSNLCVLASTGPMLEDATTEGALIGNDGLLIGIADVVFLGNVRG